MSAVSPPANTGRDNSISQQLAHYRDIQHHDAGNAHLLCYAAKQRGVPMADDNKGSAASSNTLERAHSPCCAPLHQRRPRSSQ